MMPQARGELCSGLTVHPVACRGPCAPRVLAPLQHLQASSACAPTEPLREREGTRRVPSITVCNRQKVHAVPGWGQPSEGSIPDRGNLESGESPASRQVGTIRDSSDPPGREKSRVWDRNRFAPVCSEAVPGRGWAGRRAGLQTRGGEAGGPLGSAHPLGSPHHKSRCRRFPAGGRSCGIHCRERYHCVPSPPPCPLPPPPAPHCCRSGTAVPCQGECRGWPQEGKSGHLEGGHPCQQCSE